ncbi:MAG: chorismate mutase [Sphingobacteriales bacterium]|nr:chorismate mutase [Sphingobacteriales bacterium]
MTTRVSIQGYEGSFHQVAAQLYFGKETEVIPCATFKEVVKIAANKKESNGGVMAIENSIAGSILPNYNLLQKSNLKIVGEIYLQIRQNLLVNPGVKLEDIREVHSHPMAILQCLEYLEKYNWKLIETEDTALSAKHVHQHRSKHTAAIASKLAAELFELNVIAPNIHTMKNNYTRFLILQREDVALPVNDANKASVNFHTDHSRGSLAKVLTAISNGNMEQFNSVINEVKPLTAELKVYGTYKRGAWK